MSLAEDTTEGSANCSGGDSCPGRHLQPGNLHSDSNFAAHSMRKERVLVVTERCLGDSVMTLPLVEVLESHWAALSFLSPGGAMRALLGSSRNFIPEPPAHGLWADLRTAASLRKERFDIAVVAKTSFRSAWIARIAGIRRRVGHAVEGRSWLLTDPVPYHGNAYEAFSLLDLARPLGITVSLRRPRLRVPAAKWHATKDLLEGATIGVHAGATSEHKRVPSEVLATAAAGLQWAGSKIVLLGVSQEMPHACGLAKRLDQPVVNLVGKTDLPTLIAVLPNLDIVFGGDTGLLHLAAALGVPTVQAFGPTVYKGWGNAFGTNEVIVSPSQNIHEIAPEALLSAVNRVYRSTSHGARLKKESMLPPHK